MPTESWVVAGPQIIEVEQVDSLRVQLVGGRVDVVVHDDPAETGVRIEVHAVSGKRLEVSLADGELRVGYSFTLVGWEAFVQKFRTLRDQDSADVHIAVPRTIAVKLGTVTAEGLLTGVQHDASVSTVSGSIVTDSTRGALSANTVSGEIVVRGHTGDLTLNSVSGDLTAAGDLARVHANTVAGALVLDVSAGTPSIGATTVSGDITVRLPLGRGVNVEARSVTGRVVVDGHDYKSPLPGQTKVDLRSGDGACFVSTTSVSGHLTVLRGGVS